MLAHGEMKHSVIEIKSTYFFNIDSVNLIPVTFFSRIIHFQCKNYSMNTILNTKVLNIHSHYRAACVKGFPEKKQTSYYSVCNVDTERMIFPTETNEL